MSTFVTFVASLMLVTLAIVPCRAYSAGAPIGVCGSMTPNHHSIAPQASVSPYRLIVSTNQARIGESVTVTIDGITPANTIKGFLLEARQDGKIVGWFDASGESKYAQTIDCDEKPQVIICVFFMMMNYSVNLNVRKACALARSRFPMCFLQRNSIVVVNTLDQGEPTTASPLFISFVLLCDL